MAPNVYHTAAAIDLALAEIPAQPVPLKVLLCDPQYFDVVDVKNVHMEGQQVDKEKALQQWSHLHQTYQQLHPSLVKEVSVLEGAPGCEDMVFCANQSFPWLMPDGEQVVVMSKMRHPSRQAEVPYFRAFFTAKGYRTLEPQAPLFEGMGDTIPHPGKRLLWGGYGHRSDPTAYEELSQVLQVPVMALELVDERFYHLDTCFLPISAKTVLLCEAAFSSEGLAMIRQLFEEVIAVPEKEAAEAFALNAHCLLPNPNQKVAIIQSTANWTIQTLRTRGFQVFPIDTSEFIRSGGSVFCMKMMYY